MFNPDDLRRLFKQIREKRGKIDIVVVASSAPDDYVPLSEITREHYEAVFGHPVTGVLFTIEKALPLLSDGASIILNTAIASATRLAGNSLHSATVEAVLSFARALTKQLEDRWIRGFSLEAPQAVPFRKTVGAEGSAITCRMHGETRLDFREPA